MAEYYNKIYDNENFGTLDADFMICMEKISCLDLIGKKSLSKKKVYENLFRMKLFMLNVDKERKYIVFDFFNEIPSEVTERVNNISHLNLNSD